ncbi:MAG: HNH endonuclease [Bacteroidota bacterium]
MHLFRQHTPKHTKNRRVCKHYRSYKLTLRSDFNKRCGYCNDFYHDHKKYFVIDHFIPQNPDGWLHSIPSNKYSNLIYACSYCNGAKSNKWPTMNPQKFNEGGKGFIKPTNNAYSKLFKRDTNGSIIVHKDHPIGKYIYEELNFFMDYHAWNWKVERIFEQEEILRSKVKTIKDPNLEAELKELQIIRLKFIDLINDFRDNAK